MYLFTHQSTNWRIPQLAAKYIPIICGRFCGRVRFHCCNQWGCMTRRCGCHCRKRLRKIIPVKKNYTDQHIIIINPNDKYQIGTVTKVVPLPA